MASLGAILPGARLGLMVHALVALPRSLALPASLFYAAYCLHRQTGRQNRRFLKIGGPMDELGLIFLVKKPFFVIGNGANTSESTIACHYCYVVFAAASLRGDLEIIAAATEARYARTYVPVITIARNSRPRRGPRKD